MSASIDYRYLKAFHLTAKYLNFSKAAQELGIAQSAVSRQIKLLEDSMQEQLIVRSSKKVLLTQRGKSLYKTIDGFEIKVKEIIQAQNCGPQHIRVGILHGLLENWFIQVTTMLTTTTPHELSITVDTPSVLKQKLIDGKLDLIFTTENIQSDLISSLKLFDERLVLISKASKEKIDIRKLHEYTWINYPESDFLLNISKKRSKQVITVQSMTAIIKLVKAGVGVAIVPSHMVTNEDQLQKYEVTKLPGPQIHLSSLNYQNIPSYLQEFNNIVMQFK
jgi:DNA-binding transcriptional LysR family regulator